VSAGFRRGVEAEDGKGEEGEGRRICRRGVMVNKDASHNRKCEAAGLKTRICQQPSVELLDKHKFKIVTPHLALQHNLPPHLNFNFPTQRIMATGIEIAGLVLAALPFAIEGIKFYANGARTMKEMRHHQHVLDEFSRELDMEKVKFVNTCLNLLEDTVTSDVMSKLMNDPTGDLWKGNDLQEKLCDRLRSHSVPHFVQAMETMKKVIDELNEKFGIDENTVRRQGGDLRASHADPTTVQQASFKATEKEVHPSSVAGVSRGATLAHPQHQ